MNPKEDQEYKQFFGIACLIIELGRVDILYEVSLLTIHLNMPQKGHMQVMMGVFVYIYKAYGKTVIVDTIIPKVYTLMEIKTNWFNIIFCEDNQK